MLGNNTFFLKHFRKPFNLNDENSEPPPPGFEMQPSRNPFHSNNALSPPSSNRDRDRAQRNNTPDLYEKCVSQDLEDNKVYNIGKKTDRRSGSRSGSRSRSRSRSSIRTVEKRRKLHRSTTPKGKPSVSHSKRDNALSSHGKHKSEERNSKKDKELNEHESKRRSMTPPRVKELVSEMHQTSPETDHKDRKDKSEKRSKERKKRRKDKSERKKIKKEKKSKKERHRQKMEEEEEEKDNTNKNDEEEEEKVNASALSLEIETKADGEVVKQDDLEEEGEYHSMEKELPPNVTPKNDQNDSSPQPVELTPNHQAVEYREKTPTSDIKCFDAVLDIHEYETDFDDNSFKHRDNSNKLVPEASKWELEDPGVSAVQFGDDKSEGKLSQNNTDNKVTNDVIVRAEKAIFARAINAIRPLEARKKSVSKERSSKCYGDDNDNMRNIQITLPVNISKERSIEVKSESSEKKKSIKDRLGSKISQPIFSQVGDPRRETYPTDRDKDHDRRTKAGLDSKIATSKRNEHEKNSRDRQARDRGRNRESEKERDRERDRDRGRDKEKNRHREKANGDKDREHEKDKNRERTRERGHDYVTDRGGLHSKSKDHKVTKPEKPHHSSEKDHREHENVSRKRHQSNTSPTSQRKRSISSSSSDSDDGDRKRKHAKSEKKTRKRSESPDSESGKKSSKKKNKADKKKKKKSKK